MADPFSLSVGIITLFKETYLIAAFIYKTLRSAKHSEKERGEIASNMRSELLILQSFGRHFTKINGTIVGDIALDELWLQEIHSTLQHLRKDFADYTQLAGQEDTEYIEYSPWYNGEKKPTALIEFDLEKVVPAVEEASFLNKLPRLWHDSKTKMREVGLASKWALWDAKRLEDTVRKFHKRNAKLKDVLQLAMATQLQESSDALKTLLEDEDAKTLGLAARAKIHELVHKPGNISTDFTLNGLSLFSDSRTSSLHIGTCEITSAKGNVVRERILIEYKDYPLVSGGLEDAEIVKTEWIIKSRTQQLAGLLSASGENRLGTLPFKGLVDQRNMSRHAFVFNFPLDADTNSSPETLHSVIDTPSSANLWPLAARFRVAQTVAKSIGAFHADGWVHKGVRSQSVAFFKNRDSKILLRDSPYLVDIEYSRPESGSTLLLRDNDDEKNLYRHPEIQDVARSSFSKLHDIYSLGVVLLEIAMWQTARGIVNDVIKRDKFKPDAVNAIGLQKIYINRTKRRVEHLMGTAYQSAVLACLENRYKDQILRPDFSMVFHEEVTQKLSARYIV